MKTITEPTHKTMIAQVREELSDQIQQISQLLGWTPQQYCQYQFEQYTIMLEIKFSGYPAMCKEMMYSPIIRGVFNNEWRIRNNEVFMPRISMLLEPDVMVTPSGDLTEEIPEINKSLIYAEYCFIHNGRFLVHNPQLTESMNQVYKTLIRNK